MGILRLSKLIFVNLKNEQTFMNYSNEFRNFAIKDQGINNMYYDKIISSMYPTNLTPNIIEERQMNAVAMDVFSRLMMDRIIFLGTGINDQVANIVQAQMPLAIFKFTSTLPAVACTRAWGFMILCNS